MWFHFVIWSLFLSHSLCPSSEHSLMQTVHRDTILSSLFRSTVSRVLSLTTPGPDSVLALLTPMRRVATRCQNFPELDLENHGCYELKQVFEITGIVIPQPCTSKFTMSYPPPIPTPGPRFLGSGSKFREDGPKVFAFWTFVCFTTGAMHSRFEKHGLFLVFIL